LDNFIRLIDEDILSVTTMKEKGFGGTRYLVTTEDNNTYVAKIEYLNQTLNEVMAQIIIKSIGLVSIDVAFVMANDIYYGALKYIDGLKRIGDKNFSILNKEQKNVYIEHLLLNFLLSNSDNGEIYLTKDGNIISLDYGDAGLDMFLFNLNNKSDSVKKVVIDSALASISRQRIIDELKLFIDIIKTYFIDDDLSYDDVKRITVEFLNKLSNLDFSNYQIFLETLEELNGDIYAFIYQEYMNKFIETVKEIIPLIEF